MNLYLAYCIVGIFVALFLFFIIAAIGVRQIHNVHEKNTMFHLFLKGLVPFLYITVPVILFICAVTTIAEHR